MRKMRPFNEGRQNYRSDFKYVGNIAISSAVLVRMDYWTVVPKAAVAQFFVRHYCARRCIE